MQKDIIDKIREKEGYFLIELKANQPTLRYGVEDRLRQCVPRFSYREGPELGHGRIETRTYNVYDGLELIADKDKWGGNLTVVEVVSHCTKNHRGRRRQKRDCMFQIFLTIPPGSEWLSAITGL